MSAGPLLSRMRSAAGLLAAVFVMATVSTTLTALVPAYSSSIVEAGLQRTIAEADADEQTVTFTWRGPGSGWDRVSARSIATADELLAGASSPAVFAETDSYRVGAESESTIAAIAVVDAEDLYRSVTSAEPAAFGSVPASLHVDAAAHLGVELGDTVLLERRDELVSVEVVELLATVDPTDPRWFEEPFGRDGVIATDAATEVGPFFVAPEWFADHSGTVTYRGRFALDPSAIDAGTIDEVVDGVEAASDRFADSLGATDVQLDGSLDALLVETDEALRSTGAVVGVILLQLVAVALYGLGVSAAVLTAARRGETAVARSRGASTRQLNTTTLIEATAVIVPAALAAPWLAAWAVERIGRSGPIAATGLELVGDVTTTSLVLAFGVAAVAAVVVTVATASSRERVERGEHTTGLLYRSGLDLVLIAVAVLGLWQLSRTGSVASSSSPDGRATIDPVLAIAPTLGVVAASLLALRLVRVAARALTRTGARSAALAPALAGWDAVRRPSKQARTTVLIVVAVSIGVFAAAHSVSWQRSQRDQADAAVGADIHVVPNSQPGVALAADELASAYRSIDGVDAVVPIDVRIVDLGNELTSLPLVAVDVDTFPAVDRLRPDLQPDPTALAALATPVDLGGVELTGSGEVTATVMVTVSPAADADRSDDLALTLLVADEFGSIVRLTAAAPAGAEGERIGFGSLPAGATSARLVGVEMVAPVRHVPLGAAADEILPPFRFDVAIAELAVGGVAADLGGAQWRTRDVSTDGSTTGAGTAVASTRPSGIALEFDTGINRRPRMRTTARLTTAPITEGAPAQDPLTFAVLATPGLLGRAGLAIGDEASVRIGGLRANARISGTVPVVPFATEEPLALLADRRTLATVEFTTLGSNQRPDEWALSADEVSSPSVVATLEAPPLASSAVLDRRLEAERRTRDPVLVGLTGSLLAAVLAAAVVAVLGLALTAVTEARARRADYAVLRALGARRSELRAWLVRETIPLATVAVAAGVVTGIVLAGLTVRSLTSDRDGSSAIPEPTLVVPWPVVTALVVVVMAAVIALPMLTSRLLRGTRPADELRIGDAR